MMGDGTDPKIPSMSPALSFAFSQPGAFIMIFNSQKPLNILHTVIFFLLETNTERCQFRTDEWHSVSVSMHTLHYAMMRCRFLQLSKSKR